jgi:beta-phosphoglucomutase-like phosphatase (HAD superfamily)
MGIGWLVMQKQINKMIARFDALIFDFDGVLVESTDIKTRAFGTLYENYGQEVVDQVIAHHKINTGISRFKKFQYFQENANRLTLSDLQKIHGVLYDMGY